MQEKKQISRSNKNNWVTIKINYDVWLKAKEKADKEGLKFYKLVECAIERYLKNGRTK